jgi:hypothetical protein
MRRVAWGAWALTGLVVGGLVIGWSLTGPRALRAAPENGVAPLARGWGRLVASGVLTAVNRTAGTVLFSISGAGRLDVFEGGTAWRRTTIGGTRMVHLLPATLFIDAGTHPLAEAAMRPGTPAAVWAVVRPDAAILALTLEVASRGPGSQVGPRVEEGAGAVGVVTRRLGSTLTLVTDSGARRSIVLTAATVVRRGEQPVPVAGLGPYDVLRIDGLVNSDGSLVATRVDVEFTAASAAQVSGPVELNVSGLGGLVVAGTLVCTSAETYILRNEAREPVTRVTPGLPVAVYGTPVAAGGTAVALDARVIVVR